MSNRRGSESEHSEPRFLVIGQVTKPHGVRGEVRVMPHTDLPERFGWLEAVYVGEAPPVQVAVDSARVHKGFVLLKLAGCDNRDEAQKLRGKLLQIPEDQAIPLEENEYFLHDVVGLSVETEDGTELGAITEVIETGANNVFVVKGSKGEVLIPDTDEVVVDIDFEQNRMIIHPLPGLLSA